jgi:hypothetical protein
LKILALAVALHLGEGMFIDVNPKWLDHLKLGFQMLLGFLIFCVAGYVRYQQLMFPKQAPRYQQEKSKIPDPISAAHGSPESSYPIVAA